MDDLKTEASETEPKEDIECVALDITDFEEEIDKHAKLKSFKNDKKQNLTFNHEGNSIPCNEIIHGMTDEFDPSDSAYQESLRSNMTYICQLCDRHYRSQSRALIHISQVHYIANLDAIKYCTNSKRSSGVTWERVTLSVEEQLSELEERRSESHFKLSPYKCYSCAMSFSFPDTFQNHNIKHHENSGSFMCDICYSLFETQTELMRHERYHKDRYKCSLCGHLLKCHTFISTRFTHEAKHASSKKSGTKTVFTCNYCNNTYNDQKLLAAHIRSAHFFPEEYQCMVCKKILTTKTGYKVHTAMHSEAKPYQCKLCGQRFNTVSKKRKHALAHYANPNSFICDHCNRTFEKKNSLKAHIYAKHPE